MLQALVSTASRLLNDLNQSLFHDRLPDRETLTAAPPPGPRKLERLKRVVLTDEVCRTLFEEFAAHRKGKRGEEETGWLLLGRREIDEAIVLATLPAGVDPNAGVAHVWFNPGGQALASRIVRQWDRRLATIGVVHTHPGSLRHPSDGDYRGDSQWVGQLRGGEGIFGIGTADGEPADGTAIAYQPQANVQCLGELCFSWYALGHGERKYRRLPISLTLGPDLARCLHPLWLTVESYAEPLDRLYRQQAGVTFEVLSKADRPSLAVRINLADPKQRLLLILEDNEVRYYLERDGDLVEIDAPEPQVDRGVYLILAELAGQC